jgi:hypothetical protein
MRDYSAGEQLIAAAKARDDLYFFARWMFAQRRRYRWIRGPHHKAICDALMRVFRGECIRLIINIPPRYSKTELAVVNFIAWALGQVPDAEFIHASYAAPLAVANSAAVRALVQHEAYQAIFPECRLASDAKSHWTTTAGGVMYAAGAGGTITGFGAGKHRAGFGGCFPIGTRVWTDRGLLPIDQIVRERLCVRAWAFDYAGRMVLRPVVGWHENPPNEIVRVTFDDGAKVECTPDHRFWTTNRGWVRADSLRVDDCLPRVRSGIERADDIGIHAQSGGGGLNSAPVLAASPVAAIEKGGVGLRFGQDGSEVGRPPALANDVAPTRYGLPGVAAPDLLDHGGGHAESVGQRFGGLANGVVDGQGLLVGQDGNRVNLGFAECPVALTVNNVGGASVVSEVGEAVVCGVAVEMANIGASGPWANERGQHERVYERVFDLRVSGQANAKVSAGLYAGTKLLTGLDVRVAASGVGDFPVLAPDVSLVADGVQPFISGHRKPALVEHVRHDDSTFCLTVDEYHNFTVESGLVVKNCIIIDDPHKADEARSDVIRQGVIDWFQNTLESRKNSPSTPIILIMQRLHERDLAGWLLDGGNGETWEHVCLPAITPDGAALWPEKHSLEDLRRMEKAAPYVFAGQYL